MLMKSSNHKLSFFLYYEAFNIKLLIDYFNCLADICNVQNDPVWES